MSKRVGDACLAALSAFATSFSFKMRDWTGISRSVEWPIGAAILLMIVWLFVQRKDGIRTNLLLASLIGIGTGLTIGSVVHRLELGRSVEFSLVFLLPVAGCSWLYYRNEQGERKLPKGPPGFRRNSKTS